MSDSGGQNGWNEWSRHVLAELERLNAYCERIEKKLNEAITDIATLKVKAGVWGAIGGAVPVALGLLVWLLKKD